MEETELLEKCRGFCGLDETEIDAIGIFGGRLSVLLGLARSRPVEAVWRSCVESGSVTRGGVRYIDFCRRKAGIGA